MRQEPATAEDRDVADLLAAFAYRGERWLTARDIVAETGLGEFEVRSRLLTARHTGVIRAMGVSAGGATLYAPAKAVAFGVA